MTVLHRLEIPWRSKNLTVCGRASMSTGDVCTEDSAQVTCPECVGVLANATDKLMAVSTLIHFAIAAPGRKLTLVSMCRESNVPPTRLTINHKRVTCTTCRRLGGITR